MDWQGVIGFPVTAMDRDGEEVRLDVHRRVIDRLVEGGVHGIGVLGSTGEYAYLSRQERQSVIRATVDQVGGRVPVLAGISAITTGEAVRNAREAADEGVDALFLGLPTYFPLTRDEVLTHLQTVISSTELPICLYNNPTTSRQDLVPELVQPLCQYRNVEAIKEDSGNIDRVNLLQSSVPDGLAVLAGGCDPIALPSFALGARGWCTALPNLLPREAVELHRLAVIEQDMAAARRLHERLLPVARLLTEHNLASMAKAGLAILGTDTGSPRPPLQPADEDRVARLEKALAVVTGNGQSS